MSFPDFAYRLCQPQTWQVPRRPGERGMAGDPYIIDGATVGTVVQEAKPEDATLIIGMPWQTVSIAGEEK